MNEIKKKLLCVMLAGVLCTAAAQGTAAVPASAASYNSSGVICDDRLGEGQIVFYPESLLVQNEETYPVIVWANGTMCAPVLYYGLLSGLAEHGYIVVASRELFAGNGNAQRASIDFITAENYDAGSVFYGKADLAHIGAAGHSQGGMSAVNACPDRQCRAADRPGVLCSGLIGLDRSGVTLRQACIQQHALHGSLCEPEGRRSHKMLHESRRIHRIHECVV